MITNFKIFEYLDITEKPSFKKWFRDSKVVINGKPLMLYHYAIGVPLSELGFYFKTKPTSKNVIIVYLSLQNPKYMTENDWNQISDNNIGELRKDLINQGYDGIIINNSMYVAFFSNLVKSAIGNNGDFDINNFNINEKFSDRKPGKDGLLNSKSISKEMKDKILPYISNISYYYNKKVLDLTIPKIEGKCFNGVSLGADKNGFYVYTHRCRSHSYESPEKIPNSKIKFIESTG